VHSESPCLMPRLVMKHSDNLFCILILLSASERVILVRLISLVGIPNSFMTLKMYGQLMLSNACLKSTYN
jgi:hypothetical protein